MAGFFTTTQMSATALVRIWRFIHPSQFSADLLDSRIVSAAWSVTRFQRVFFQEFLAGNSGTLPKLPGCNPSRVDPSRSNDREQYRRECRRPGCTLHRIRSGLGPAQYYCID